MKPDKQLIQHFPWQRLVMTLFINGVMLFTMHILVGWLYYFATIDPALTTAAVQTSAITALSASAGVMFVCMAAVNIWFITGSSKTVEAMFRFNAATMAQTAMQSASQAINEKKEEHIIEEHIEHVITEGDPGAPERRPFNPDESHEQPQ